MAKPARRDSTPTGGSRASPLLPNIEWLIGDGGGAIHVGRVGPIECVASAADDHICYAMLARRDGETLLQLLHRLDKSIEIASETSETIDEINGP
jgi:hypothetical protein